MDAQKSPARMASEATAAAAAEQRLAFRECGVCARVRVLARLGEGRSWDEACQSYGHGCPVMLAGDGSKQRLQVQQITGGGAGK